MKLSRKDLEWAAAQNIITQEQADTLWKAFNKRSENASKFDFIHLAYYAGALIVILAMTWFLTISWEAYGPLGIFLIATAYAACFALTARHLWFTQNLKIPGGLLCTLSVCMTPLIVYALERLTGLWPQDDPGQYQNFHIYVKGSWFLIETATIFAGMLALRWMKFPFLTAPVSYCLWYMSMDMTPLLFGKVEYDWSERLWVSIAFGIIMLSIAYYVDLKKKDQRDFAFWFYLFGTISFWSGVALMDKANELNEFFCGLIYVSMILLSVLLQRKIFMVFGAIGTIGYLSHLAWTIFKDSPLFPIALSGLGIAIIALGVSLQQHHEIIERSIQKSIPESWKRFLPER